MRALCEGCVDTRGSALIYTHCGMEHSLATATFGVEHTVRYGMVEVCEGAQVAVSGWVLNDRHGLAPCAANSLHRATISANNIIGYMGTLGIAWACN